MPYADLGLPFAVFDVHSHIFNARDVQLAGYLKGPVANDLEGSQPELANVLRALALPIQFVAQRIAPSLESEVAMMGSAPQPGIKTLQGVDLPSEESQARDRLVQLLNETEFKKTLQFDLQKSGRMGLFSKSLDNGTFYSREEVDRILDETEQRHIKGYDETLSSAHPEGGVLTFLKHMLCHRYFNMESMWNTYRASESIRPDAFLTALVDFDYWLEPGGHNRTPSCLADQVRMSEALAIRSGGAILPLVPYNPWTDIVESGSPSLALVKNAVMEHGFVGVKLYPVLGYAPYGNVEAVRKNNIPSIWRELAPGKDPVEVATELDKRMFALLTWCGTNDVPIMAHTNHSKGTGDEALNLAGPDYWVMALHAAFQVTGKPLRINLGHFGGNDTKYCGGLGAYCWQKGFIRALGDANASQFFDADLAYWNDLFLGNDPDTKTFLSAAVARGEPLRSHVMYGSDWFMLTQEKAFKEYVERVYVWANSLDPELARKVFQDNAADLFGFRKGKPGEKDPATRARLERFYKKNKIPAPGWMTKLDGSPK